MLSSPTGPGRGQRPDRGWTGGLWIISRVRGIGLGVNDRRRTGPDHPRLVPDTLVGLRAFHVMSRVLTSRCARSTALARTVADRAGQQIVRTVSPAHSFHPGAGGQGHRIPQNGARQDRAGQVHSRGPVPSGCAPVPVAADIGSDTAERSAWHCPPLMTRMSTGNRDPVTARRRRSRRPGGAGRRPGSGRRRPCAAGRRGIRRCAAKLGFGGRRPLHLYRSGEASRRGIHRSDSLADRCR